MNLIQRMLRQESTDSVTENPLQPATTYSGTKIPPVQYGLPKVIESICPECMEIIDATLYPESGKVWIKKTCKEHGEFKDIFYGDIDLYYRCEELWYGDGRGVEDPPIRKATVCPKQCGLCNMHTSHSGLPIVDLTNRCNMTCPVCFANANAAGYLYEPTYEQVVDILTSLANQKPVPANRVQFSGGEPTVRPDFLKIVKTARDMGFDYVQTNTNGIKFAELEFAQAAREAGVDNIYLQFDGLSDETYKRTRARSMLDIKMQAIENCRKVNIAVIPVVTLVKSYNDHEVGDIVRFAIENNDVISGIAFQPVSFVGRFSQSHRLEKRYTLADLAKDIERQTGLIKPMRDWFPIAVTSAISRLATGLSGKPQYTLTLHPHCSQGTYFFISEDKKEVKPISEFLDLEPFLAELNEISLKVKPSSFNLLSKVNALYRLNKYFHKDRAPKGLTFKKFLECFEGYQDRSKRSTYEGEDGRKPPYGTLFIAAMHFMDAYNFSVERVKRCVIHYPDPKGHLYPFCAYNGAPVYRRMVENRYKLSPEELKKKYNEEGRPADLEKLAKKVGIV